ncbi:MAG: class I SAM-dependent methyltransferase [Halobacteria archaeon]|nr:class I SAM-dependent methyltransferase [Halobacteria archaeon]
MEGFVCPRCGSSLEGAEPLRCTDDGCASVYKVSEGIPDFADEHEPDGHSRRMMRLFDLVSSVYETPLWYPLGIRLGSSFSVSVSDVVGSVRRSIEPSSSDRVLDAACGTGIFARAIAPHVERVDGVDLSWEMLKEARRRTDDGSTVLARADVEKLPYEDEVFDAAVCSGALHVLPNTRETVKEISRVLKPGGCFAGMTLVSEGPLSSDVPGSEVLRRGLEETVGLRIFDVSTLSDILADAGFEGFYRKEHGSILVFRATKT